MFAAFGNFAGIQDNYLVGINDSGQAMGDHKRRVAARDFSQRDLYFALSTCVERGSRLVKDQYAGVFKYGPGEALMKS